MKMKTCELSSFMQCVKIVETSFRKKQIDFNLKLRNEDKDKKILWVDISRDISTWRFLWNVKFGIFEQTKISFWEFFVFSFLENERKFVCSFTNWENKKIAVSIVKNFYFNFLLYSNFNDFSSYSKCAVVMYNTEKQ